MNACRKSGLALGLLTVTLLLLCPIHRASAMSGQANTQAAAAPQSPFAALIAEYIRRDTNGHSPTPEEIAAMASLTPTPDAASVREALPFLLKALANPDTPLRAFALSALTGLQTHPPDTGPPQPAAFKPDIARILTPSIPEIAAHLTDESEANRLQAVAVIAGFTSDPPAAVYPPLLAYLKRDDSISTVGLAVVSAILQLAPVSDDAATAIARYLRRSDETPDVRANLVDSIASAKYQSQSLNKSLLSYLDSDDSGLRARIILTLPALDLAPPVFAGTRARITQLAEDPNENLQVINAAKAVAPCWTATKMTAGCPVYQ